MTEKQSKTPLSTLYGISEGVVTIDSNGTVSNSTYQELSDRLSLSPTSLYPQRKTDNFSVIGSDSGKLFDIYVQKETTVTLPDPSSVDSKFNIILCNQSDNGSTIKVKNFDGSSIIELGTDDTVQIYNSSGAYDAVQWAGHPFTQLDKSIYGDFNNAAWGNLKTGTYFMKALGSELSNQPTEITLNPASTYFIVSDIAEGSFKDKSSYYKQQCIISTDSDWTNNTREFSRSGLNLATAITTGWKVKAFLSDVHSSLSLPTLQDNEMLAYKDGKIVGTGITGLNGDAQFAAGTVSVGLHDISSGGENVVIVNRASNKKYSPVWQEISENGSRETVIRVNEKNLQTNSYQTDISKDITNPSYSITLGEDLTIFETEYNAAAAQTNVHFNLREQGASEDIWRSKARDLKVGVNTYKLSVPLDLKAGVNYVLSAYSNDGDVVLKGNTSDIPYFKFKYQTYEDKPLYPTDDNEVDSQHTWTGGKINTVLQQTTQVLQSDISQKISGIHVEDVDNNAFDDITALHFDGAVVSDDGSQQATITVHPKFTVANGQSPSASSAIGNAIVFNGGAGVRPDINDNNVIHVDLPSGSTTKTPFIIDGSTYNNYNSIDMVDFTANMNDQVLELTAPVTPTSSGIEIDNSGVNMAGVTKLNFPTSEILAKSQTEADIIPYQYFDKEDGTQVHGRDVRVFGGLEVQQTQGDDDKIDLYVNPRSFEPQHSASCLLQLDSDITLQTGKETKLYTSHEIIPTGEFYSLNKQSAGVNVQDNTGGDTAVTGGELTRIMGSVAFYGKATDNSNVKIWFEYKDPANVLATSILEDVNGNPMIVERYYNQGDDLSEPLIIAGAMMAKGQAPLILKVEVSAGSYVVNPDQTLICIEQFSDGYETSIASIEFQRRLGVEIHAEIKQFTAKMLSMKNELLGVDEPLSIVKANTGYDFLNEFGVQNLTDVQASIANDALNISDNNNIADFYVDVYIDNVKTQMLRGKAIDYDVTIKNYQDAFYLEVYKWVGKPDNISKLYNNRNNDVLNLNTGWSLIKSKFIAENVAETYQGVLDTATIPDDANNILIVVRPQAAQSPTLLSLKDFTWGVATPFKGYAETSRVNLNEIHLKYSENWAEFALNNQGYQSIRYTINNTSNGNPMPVGKLLKGKAPVEIDHTVNQVSGSQDPENDGGIKFLKDGRASISKSYNLRNEQNTESSVTFWDMIVDSDGVETKIIGSERTFKVPANTGAPGVIYSIPAYDVQIETGQRVIGRAKSDKADGAYVQSDNFSEYLVQIEIDFKEEIAVSGDDPFSGIDLSQFDRVHTSGMTVTKIVQNSASANIPLALPSDVDMVVLDVIKHNSDGSIRKVKNLDYSYKDNVLAVSFGETVSEAKIIIGVYI